MPELTSDVSGGIVFWRLSGAVDYDDLEAAWHGAGLDAGLLPAPVARSVALKRTMKTFADRSILVRPLKGDVEGFILVHESYVDGKPQYQNGLTVTLDAHGAPVLDPFDPDTARQVEATFAHHLTALTQQDISGWLVDLIRGVQAVRLRDTGGLYFVPRTHLDLWRGYVGAIRAASHCKLFEIPALHSDEAVAAVLDAVTREAEEAAGELEEELADKELSRRALGSRGRKIEALEHKLATYEELLGVKLDALRGEFGRLQAHVARKLLAADGEGSA